MSSKRTVTVRRIGKIFLFMALLSAFGCTSFVSDPAASKISELKELPIGTNKADVLKSFGAPQKIEIQDKKFRYTYFGPIRRKNTPKVVVYFDENNKVVSKTY